MHGIACWFDVLFDGSVQPRWLTTAPGQPTTHWCGLLGLHAPAHRADAVSKALGSALSLCCNLHDALDSHERMQQAVSMTGSWLTCMNARLQTAKLLCWSAYPSS